MSSGVVLAGGRSTRFGEADKAVADLAGRPMIRRVADRVTSVVDDLVVNCREDQVDVIAETLAGLAVPTRFAPDPEPDRGPLAGMASGLRAVEAAYAVVIACDMPFVEPALLELLLDRAAGRDAAVPRLDDGWYQPTQAVYRSGPTVEACEAALARGDGRIIEAFDDLDVAVVGEATVRSVATLDTFENLNTREAFDEAAARLAAE